MKQVKSVIILFLCSLFAMTSITAQETETRTFSDFHGITVGSIVSAEMQKGSVNKVEISVRGNELSDVKTEIENGVLKIGMKKNRKKYSWSNKNKVNVVITYTTDPNKLSVGSSADLIGNDVIKGRKLNLSVSSSGDMDVAIDVEELDASVSSSGDLTVEGKASKAKVSASSSADFEGDRLIVQDADLSASSSADITIHVERSLKARASSSADITYLGSPGQKDISKSGQADIEGR